MSSFKCRLVGSFQAFSIKKANETAIVVPWGLTLTLGKPGVLHTVLYGKLYFDAYQILVVYVHKVYMDSKNTTIFWSGYTFVEQTRKGRHHIICLMNTWYMLLNGMTLTKFCIQTPRERFIWLLMSWL